MTAFADAPPRVAPGCMLCEAERITAWLFEDDRCWAAECLVCRTPMVVWRPHGLPDAALELELLAVLERLAIERWGPGGYWIDRHRTVRA